MSDDLDQTAANLGLGIIDSVATWLRWRFGPPPLDLVFEGDQGAFLMTDGLMDAAGQAIKGRWHRVGVVNRSQVTIDDVVVTAEQLTPPKLPGLPQPLHWMNDNPPPGTAFQATSSVQPDRTPSKYVDVVSYRADQSDLELRLITPESVHSFPKGCTTSSSGSAAR